MSKNSQGPGRVVLIGSAVLMCATLLAAIYFFRDEATRAKEGRLLPAASTVAPLFERCDGEPKVEHIDGITRTTCTSREPPQFMVFTDVRDGLVEQTSLMVPIHRERAAQLEQNKVGLEMFSLVAGAPVRSFLPEDQLAVVGIQETRFVREGLLYMTQPMGNVGLVFSVGPPPSEVATDQ